MTDVETEKENSTQKYFFHKIYDKYLNLNQVRSNFQQKNSIQIPSWQKKNEKENIFLRALHSFQTQIFSAKFKLPCSKYYVCNSSRIVRQTLAKILRGQKLHQSFFFTYTGIFLLFLEKYGGYILLFFFTFPTGGNVWFFFSFLKHYFFLFLKSFPKHRLERFLRLLMHIYTWH